MKPSRPIACALPDTVCIDVTGPDAEAFLRAQLARNPPPPGRTGGSVPAAWLDARGRVRALFRTLAVENGYGLLAEAETAEQVAAKLRLFVLRSRVSLSVNERSRVVALVGGDAELEGGGQAALEGRVEAGLDARGEAELDSRGEAQLDGSEAGLDGGVARLAIGPGLALAVGPQAVLDAATAGLARGEPELAALAEIRLGLPRIGAALAERYVPQMLNLDLLEAVSFDKGCYPGQEVVARLNYRGRVKRRMRRFACSMPAARPAPGDELLDAGGAAAGEVVRAARADGGMELLAVVALDAETPLALAADPAVALERRPLPYESISPRA